MPGNCIIIQTRTESPKRAPSPITNDISYISFFCLHISERRFYQKITDIYATALDYDRTAKTTKQFFAKVQNKMHYAVHGHTAAELIYERADADKPHMGLTTWAAAPEGKIVKSDVSIAKNYLTDKEMRSLERIVSAYLDLAMERCRHQP